MPELDEAVLGAALRAIDAPASIPDITALVAAGRRRDRWRRSVAAAGVFVTVAGVVTLATLVVGGHHAALKPAGPPGLTSCVAGPVTPLAGDSGMVTAADPTGRYAVGILGHNNGNGALDVDNMIWDNGVAHPVPTVVGSGHVLNLLGVNASGWVIADSTVTVDHVEHTQPALYRDGQWTVLPMPAGAEHGVANSINSRGDIVGRASAGGTAVKLALLWPAAHPGTVLTLPIPNPYRSAAAATISDAGVIGGFVEGISGPYVWTSPTSGHALPVPDGMQSANIRMIQGNYAVGYASSSGVTLPIAEWDLRSGVVRLDKLPAGVDEGPPGSAQSGPKVPDGLLGGLAATGAHAIYVNRPGERISSYLVQPGGGPTISVPAPPGVTGKHPQIISMSPDGHRLTGVLVTDQGNVISGPMTWTCS